MERKVYKNDDITFFSVFMFAKPSFDNMLQSSPLCSKGCNTLSHSGLTSVNTQKRMIYPFIREVQWLSGRICWSLFVASLEALCVCGGAQWLSGGVLDSGPRGPGFESHLCHWVVVLEQDTFILA